MPDLKKVKTAVEQSSVTPKKAHKLAGLTGEKLKKIMESTLSALEKEVGQGLQHNEILIEQQKKLAKSIAELDSRIQGKATELVNPQEAKRHLTLLATSVTVLIDEAQKYMRNLQAGQQVIAKAGQELDQSSKKKSGPGF